MNKLSANGMFDGSNHPRRSPFAVDHFELTLRNKCHINGNKGRAAGGVADMLSARMKTAYSLAPTISALMLVASACISLAGDPPAAPALPANHPALSLAAAPEPVWHPPTNWTVAPQSAMVVKSFTIAGPQGQAARVAVSSFPGDVGGTFQNVNRWRAQIGLPPIPESALPTVTQSIDVAGGKATLVDLSNPEGKPARLAAVIVPRGASTWFYKLTGDAPVVAQEEAAFVKFAQTAVYPQP
jgi:hypothetical protein